MSETKVSTPVAPYANYTTNGSLVFVSGQVPCTADGGVLAGAPIEEQTRAAMENLAAVLASAGSSLGKAKQIFIWLTNYSEDFERMNASYRAFFPDGSFPARLCLGVSDIWGGCRIEINAIASL